MEAVERNWAELLPDLLHLIAKKLPDICDFIRSRAVCKPWRSAISVSDLPPQFPWILKLGKRPDLEFYSIASNKVYTIHAPSSSDKELFGPAEGYMLARRINRNHISLLNPLNNSEVFLPVLNGYQIDVPLFGPQIVQSDDAVLVSVRVKDYKYRFAICKAGDDKWDRIEGDRPKCYFHLNNLIFAVDDNTGVTEVIDIGSRKETYVIPPPEGEKLFRLLSSYPYHVCLVESCGEILRVGFCASSVRPDYEIDIHRLELGNGKGHPRWVKVRSIGDRMLFIDFNGDRGFCLKANDFTGFKGNCIYFIRMAVVGCTEINRYDIEDGRTVLVDCPFDFKDEITWFLPTLKFKPYLISCIKDQGKGYLCQLGPLFGGGSVGHLFRHFFYFSFILMVLWVFRVFFILV